MSRLPLVIAAVAATSLDALPSAIPSLLLAWSRSALVLGAAFLATVAVSAWIEAGSEVTSTTSEETCGTFCWPASAELA